MPNIMTGTFVQEYKDLARAIWRSRWLARGLLEQVADERFLVVGEIWRYRLSFCTRTASTACGNEEFKRMVRYAIMGQNDQKEPSFEWTVRKLDRLPSAWLRRWVSSDQLRDLARCRGFRNERCTISQQQWC